MKGFFRQRRIHQRLAKLRLRVASTDRERSPVAVARLAHNLAELSAQVGKRTEAVRWFGQSIDAYLFAGFTEAAATMCGKLIQYEPRVIRARATLAMLYLARGYNRDAAEQIRGYVDATRSRGERIDITQQKLRVLATLADDREVRTLIADSLIELGAADVGSEILRRIQEEGPDGGTATLSDQERWRRLLDAALEGPEYRKAVAV